MAAYTNVYLYAEVLCITFQPAEKSFYDIIGGERGVSSTQRQYYPGAVADEWPLSRVPAEGGMSFQTSEITIVSGGQMARKGGEVVKEGFLTKSPPAEKHLAVSHS